MVLIKAVKNVIRPERYYYCRSMTRLIHWFDIVYYLFTVIKHSDTKIDIKFKCSYLKDFHFYWTGTLQDHLYCTELDLCRFSVHLVGPFWIYLIKRFLDLTRSGCLIVRLKIFLFIETSQSSERYECPNISSHEAEKLGNVRSNNTPDDWMSEKRLERIILPQMAVLQT